MMKQAEIDETDSSYVDIYTWSFSGVAITYESYFFHCVR
jgi:hypothetical protein